jgi:DNA mismatch endonuclease (patch repair protein)
MVKSEKPLPADARTSARLSRQKQRDTGPELAVRRMVHRLGRRFRVDNRDLPGSPDLANRARKWALFVHGCFWHAHSGCARATLPKSNRGYWISKFEANKERDDRKVAELRARGFYVVVVWECELKHDEALCERLEREIPQT